MEKHRLYIVITRPNTAISKLIRFFKKDDYTHAAISLDADLENMYSFGRKHTYNPFIGKFKKESLNKGIYRFCSNLPGVIMEVEVTKKQYERVTRLIEHFNTNSNYYKYNYIGLINSLFEKEACYDDRFLCSEFVYYVLRESGIADLNMSRNLVRPVNLLELNGRVVYKGNLKEMTASDGIWSLEKLKMGLLGIIYE